jgi:neutral trehalase
MVELMATTRGNEVYNNFYLLSKKNMLIGWIFLPHKTRGKDAGREYSNRYYDQLNIPRQESYLQDVETAKSSKLGKSIAFEILGRRQRAAGTSAPAVW